MATRGVVSVLGVLLLVYYLGQVVNATGDRRSTTDRGWSAPVEVTTPGAGFPEFDPASGEWGLWPIVTGKPTIGAGAAGDEVRYLQGVLTLKGTAGLEIDGLFGPLTEAAVRDAQAFFGLPATGVVDEGTWKLVDWLAET